MLHRARLKQLFGLMSFLLVVMLVVAACGSAPATPEEQLA